MYNNMYNNMYMCNNNMCNMHMHMRVAHAFMTNK